MTVSLLAAVPQRVRVVEVGPRDGLQNEAAILSTEDKARYVELLWAAGLPDIEVTSFVSPKRVPQLADAGALFARLAPHPSTRYSALVPNRRGLDRALEAGVRAVALFTAASETFTQRNIGMTIAESLDGFAGLMDTARQNGLWVRAYVSTAFVCPFEGPIAPPAVVEVVRRLVDIGVDEISLGDTIGRAVPTQVDALTSAVHPVLRLDRLAYHFHDTRGTALANVLMALERGVSVFDSASGGVGGCPFAPGAAGNLATEDLLALLHGMGIETGVSLEGVVAASQFLASRLGRPLPSKYLQSVATPCDGEKP
jgi:isopropylmalate/homocitrate/citramalate synthase